MPGNLDENQFACVPVSACSSRWVRRRRDHTGTGGQVNDSQQCGILIALSGVTSPPATKAGRREQGLGHWSARCSSYPTRGLKTDSDAGLSSVPSSSTYRVLAKKRGTDRCPFKEDRHRSEAGILFLDFLLLQGVDGVKSAFQHRYREGWVVDALTFCVLDEEIVPTRLQDILVDHL